MTRFCLINSTLLWRPLALPTAFLDFRTRLRMLLTRHALPSLIPHGRLCTVNRKQSPLRPAHVTNSKSRKVSLHTHLHGELCPECRIMTFGRCY
ncbi:hypothetical protein BD769DRAFT_624764 [Suillus cothurnatus]|nr:hypothetical protein BD769DRAFT_624764 [Suillus cothurnatus]